MGAKKRGTLQKEQERVLKSRFICFISCILYYECIICERRRKKMDRSQGSPFFNENQLLV